MSLYPSLIISSLIKQLQQKPVKNQKMYTNQSPITFLTEDLLLKILTHLSENSDHKSFRSTCKTFTRVESIHRTHIRILRPEFITPLLSKFPNLSSLDLSICPRFDNAAVDLVISSVDRFKLRKLTLTRCSGLSAAGLEFLVRSFVCLESLDLSYCCGFGDREVAAVSGGKELREVCLDKCLNVSDVGLARIVVGCEKLEGISFKWCFDVTDVGVEFLANKCIGLKRLDVSYTKVTSEALRSIGGMEKLEDLRMVGCGYVDDSGLRYIGEGCISLQVLDVSRCDRLSSSALYSVIKGHSDLLQLHASYCYFENPMAFIYQFQDLKKLKVLGINGQQISVNFLEIISTNCRFLSEISLGKCREVTDVEIALLAYGCVNLKVLDLTCCSDLTDSSILCIAESCKYLSCLKLECCNLLTEKSFYHLGSFSLFLEEIDLTDCDGINDTGLKYLSKCSSLLSLKLGLCPNISEKGLFHVASNCTNIRELDLYRCLAIGDDGLAALSHGCKRLKKLNLSYCTEISDRGMAFLGSIKEVSDLELRGLPNITGAGLRSLAAGCRKLAELDLKHCENIDDSGFRALAYYSSNLHQINLSGCKISDMGLSMIMGNLTRIQDAKLDNLTNVSVNGLETALRRCSTRLKKLKLIASLKRPVSSEIVNTLEANGCKIRWD